MMLLLLETYLELQLWSSLQCHCHVFYVLYILKSSSLKADIIFGSS